jgi:Tol biopolymer transport system component/imidazolonepropionase-like amidohydrolase
MQASLLLIAAILAGFPAHAQDTTTTLPLKPARTVSFTTTEGTWLALDVAPDGNTIVFAMLGDLYMLSIVGGTATPITKGMGYDDAPRYSPDGKQIVFISDRDGAENLWIANADGSNLRALTRGVRTHFVSPIWSPDGKSILVSRKHPSYYGASPQLWEYDLRGGSGVALSRGKLGEGDYYSYSVGVVPSRDGRWLYYSQRTGSFIYQAQLPLWQIARRDRVTGEERIVTAAKGSALRPLISPNGKQLIYATRSEGKTGLRLRNLETGDERWVIYPIQRDDQESYEPTADLLPGYAFMPDGQSIVMYSNGKIHRIGLDGTDRIIPFTVHVTRELGPDLTVPYRVDEGPVRARVIMGAEESPDGAQLVFSALTRLYIMPRKGGAPRRLTNDTARAFQPRWSPDGTWIAYVTWDANAGGHVWKVSAGGGTPQRLTSSPAYYVDPVWSPDGQFLVAVRTPREEYNAMDMDPVVGLSGPPSTDIVRIPQNGGSMSVIAPSENAVRPQFTRDTTRLYLVQNPDWVGEAKTNSLISMRLDGSDKRTHFRVSVPNTFGREAIPNVRMALSPDGRHVVMRVRQQLFLMAVPPRGQDPPTIDISAAAVPASEISKVGADHVGWAEGGETVTWTIGSTYFRQPVAAILSPGTTASSARDSIRVTVEVPRSTPVGSVVLRGGRVITMRGDEVLARADILVTNNRIAAVGASGSVKVPSGAREVDISGLTVSPGFIDTHAHWLYLRHEILDMQAWPLRANLAYGVTSGKDVQTQESDTFTYQDLVDAGEIPGQRAFSTGPGIFWTTNFQSVDDARAMVAKYKDAYRTHIVKSYIIGDRKQRQYMVEACRQLGVMPTTEGGAFLNMDVTHAIDGFSGNEHNLPITPIGDDVAQIFAQSRMVYSPSITMTYGGLAGEYYFYARTDLHGDAKIRRFTPESWLARLRRGDWARDDEYHFPDVAAAATKILRAGGLVTVGSHGNTQGLGMHFNMWSMAMGGAKPLEIFRAATINGAHALGYVQDLGSIEPGKLADLVVFSKNPLEDIRNSTAIRYVMRNGELFDGETLDQIWPAKKSLATAWWWATRPASGGSERK